MTEVEGFIVAAWEAGDRVYVAGRLSDGRSFACLEARGEGALHLPLHEAEGAEALLDGSGARREEGWTSFHGSPLARFLLPPGRLQAALRRLEGAGLHPEGLEWGRAEDALGRRGIRGGVRIRGEPRPGRRVEAVFVNPELSPAEAPVPLRWLALDLETDREEAIVAASLVSAPPGAGPDRVERRGFLLGPETGLAGCASFADEASLLAALDGAIQDLDPDVITGWNVLDFDYRVLAARHAALGLPFLIGRSDEAARLVEREGRRGLASVPGRAVLDALRLVRGSGERFEDLRLETVSQAVLGEGKSVAEEGEDKLAELDRLRAEDPAAFLGYCIRDSELVVRILAATGLDRLTQARAGLTGLSLELAWTSIPAFERVYSAGLRERRITPPPREDRRVSGAAGGTVLDPFAGLYEGVMVFDFRSLYPSLMRTFNIDPLAYARAGARPAAQEDILAPNGARFAREEGILPSIVARYAAHREEALAAGDETAAYVYKILQISLTFNSASKPIMHYNYNDNRRFAAWLLSTLEYQRTNNPTIPQSPSK